ncbi:Hypothetical protein Mbur_1110 [Methanococcoides burtonii DSM 6242]|uniref:Uncharacterized protein n=1 Tax=Methanococcoides burtonii (strain DSM 6242 / NBRC 107633 / OCM 468 / ACE-M) TaxID=259564 RepID=Q12WY9_METBU|nr:Hypothetical protein Mbur_1110 [Methanococcoides burtonii DSM 6242]
MLIILYTNSQVIRFIESSSFLGVGMRKINKEIAIFLVFLILVVLWGLFAKVPVEDTKTLDCDFQFLFFEIEIQTADFTIHEKYSGIILFLT